MKLSSQNVQNLPYFRIRQGLSTLGKINKVIPYNKRQKKSFYRPIARFGRISLDNFIKNKLLIFEDCLHIYKYKKLKKK